MPTPLTEGHGRCTGLVDVLDRPALPAENEELRKQIRALERQLLALTRKRTAALR